MCPNEYVTLHSNLKNKSSSPVVTVEKDEWLGKCGLAQSRGPEEEPFYAGPSLHLQQNRMCAMALTPDSELLGASELFEG